MSTSLLARSALQEIPANTRAINNAHFVACMGDRIEDNGRNARPQSLLLRHFMPPILVTCGFSALVINRKVTVFFYGRSSGVLYEKVLDCNVFGNSRLRPNWMLGQSSGWQGEGSRRSNAGLIQIGKCSVLELKSSGC